MEITLFIEQLRLESKRIPELLLDALEIRAHDSISQIQSRVQEQGVDADLEPFTPYSDEYLARKKKAGKYVGHVNLTFESRMLNNIDVIESHYEVGRAFVIVRAKNEDEQKKVEYNSKTRPFLNMTRNEQGDLENNLGADAEKIVQEFMV